MADTLQQTYFTPDILKQICYVSYIITADKLQPMYYGRCIAAMITGVTAVRLQQLY